MKKRRSVEGDDVDVREEDKEKKRETEMLSGAVTVMDRRTRVRDRKGPILAVSLLNAMPNHIQHTHAAPR